MYIADMHCDSLLTVDGDHGLVNSHNFSAREPQLQFVAQFSPMGEDSPEERRRRIIKDLNIYLYECERLKLSRVQCGRDVFSAVDGGGRSVVLTLEGGGGLFADSPELNTLKGAGLSVLGLAWDDNELASSSRTKCDTGLTEEGRKLALQCSMLGITLDVSHLSDKSFYDLYETSTMPLLATHSNFRDVCDHPRNLTRDMALKLAERGGVIGINLHPLFLSGGADASADDIIRQIDFGLSLVGDEHIGFGFDIDGASMPSFISPEASIHDQVIDILLSRYSTETVERIAGLNVVEFLKNNLT